MEVKLSDRMNVIVEYVDADAVVADIGTDHGYIPIWLMKNRKCKKVILSDINSGPLEKAAENIRKYVPEMENSVDIRQGSGLDVLDINEADTVIIAGMGGILIKNILEARLDIVYDLKKMILQPRNNSPHLRSWIKKLDGFTIVNELIVKEASKYSEILIVKKDGELTEHEVKNIAQAETIENMLPFPKHVYDEFPAMYILNNTSVIRDYLSVKLSVAEKILDEIRIQGKSKRSEELLAESENKVLYIKQFVDAMDQMYCIE
jgi:tRNA (adenine22-N1)-methyltransferase